MCPHTAAIPTVEQCFDLMEQHHMLPNIKDHSIMVTRVAHIITNGLITAGHYELSLDKVIAGALLHDIGKTACLENDDDHAARGYEICLTHNLESVADIVAEHVILRNYRPANGVSEKEIIYYADKRVNHDQVVSLKDRLTYILDRYGLNNEKRCLAIKKNYALCQGLEKYMFAKLTFLPDDIANLLAESQSTKLI